MEEVLVEAIGILATIIAPLAEHLAPLAPLAPLTGVLTLALLALLLFAALIVWFSGRRNRQAQISRHKALSDSLNKMSANFEETQASSIEAVTGLLERVQTALEERVRGAVADGVDTDAVQNKLSALEAKIQTVLDARGRDDGQAEAWRDTLARLGEKLDKQHGEQGAHFYDQLQELRAALSANTNSLGDEIKQWLREKAGDADASAALAALEKRVAESAAKTDETLTAAVRAAAAETEDKMHRLEQKLDSAVNRQLSNSLGGLEKSFGNLQAHIERLSAAQTEMDKLGGDVAALSRLMISQVGGSPKTIDGRKQLGDLLAQSLLPDLYTLDAELENGKRADALLTLPGPNEKIAIDAGLSLETFADIFDGALSEESRRAARRNFSEEVLRRVDECAESFIHPPVTGDSALLFVASEAAFAEIQAHHPQAVNRAGERGVWLVSPTTLLAVINTARLAMRDYRARRQLELIQESLGEIIREAQSFELRMVEIGDHVNSAWRSVQRAESAGRQLLGKVRGLSAAPADKE